MFTSLKTIAALAIAGLVIAGAGTASAATVYVKVKPKLSMKAQTPNITLPKICKNSISRTYMGYTAKKCR
jgi:hypothetical protein